MRGRELNLECAMWKANVLRTELQLLYCLDVITKPIWHEISHETFGLLEFLILGVRQTFGLLDFLILGVRFSDSSTVPRQFVYGHFIYDTSSTDISPTDISSTTIYQRTEQLYIQVLFQQIIIFINSNFYIYYDSFLSIPLPLALRAVNVYPFTRLTDRW